MGCPFWHLQNFSCCSLYPARSPCIITKNIAFFQKKDLLFIYFMMPYCIFLRLFLN